MLAFGGGLDRVSTDISGLPLAAGNFVSVSLLSLTIPFEFLNDTSGVLMVSLDDAPNVAIVNGTSHRYSWAIPFDEPALVGKFQWYAQSKSEDRVRFTIPRYMSRLVLDLKFVTPTGVIVFPHLQAGHLSYMELLVEST